MSSRSERERIEDMLESGRAILEYTRNMSYEDFSQDRKTIRAVSYEFIVMGEAVRALEDTTKRYPDLPWKELSAVRNYATHEYFRLSLPILWNIITKELPELLGKLESIRDEL
ncbi:MAG: HepT-like ribonuclease domain-containing protein [Trueperaceae bacterium]